MEPMEPTHQFQWKHPMLITCRLFRYQQQGMLSRIVIEVKSFVQKKTFVILQHHVPHVSSMAQLPFWIYSCSLVRRRQVRPGEEVRDLRWRHLSVVHVWWHPHGAAPVTVGDRARKSPVWGKWGCPRLIWMDIIHIYIYIYIYTHVFLYIYVYDNLSKIVV